MTTFDRKFRLNKPADIKYVFDNARKISAKALIMFYTANQQDHPRLAIIINKRNVAKATVRNAIRRLVRESFRQAIPALKPFDILLLIKSADLLKDKTAFRSDLLKIWQRISN